jgi:hypothetical protein
MKENAARARKNGRIKERKRGTYRNKKSRGRKNERI